MERYLIISPHTEGECVKAAKGVLAAGYITHFDWGCKGGEHCGYAIIEAESEAQALLVVPSLIRGKAQVVRLNKYNPEDVEAMHGAE